MSAAFATILLVPALARAQAKSKAASEVRSVYASSFALYQDLHAHPELSAHETETAAKLAGQLRELGYEVTNEGG